MNWLLLPESSIKIIANSATARQAVATLVCAPGDVPEEFSISRADGFVLGRVLALENGVGLLGFWMAEEPARILIAGTRLVAVWCSSAASTIASLDPSDATSVLDRISALAVRWWDKQAFPEHWHPKSIRGWQSVFAAPQGTLKDVRFAYATSMIGSMNEAAGISKTNPGTAESTPVLRIGNLWHAYKQERALQIPDLPKFTLPSELIAPKEAVDISKAGEDETGNAEGDLRISGRGEGHHLFSHSYDQWVGSNGPLTNEQRRVIQRENDKPLRIHGPAGSGKTLVLILKTLKLLRDAQERGKLCHILFVVTSNAVATTVKAAFEAIDDRAFLASSKKDIQFLEVDTLHAWCIRELGHIDPSRDVLERDPRGSKIKQAEILSEAFEKTVTERLAKVKTILSPDFVALIEKHPKTLLEELQREISIRIKGRGYKTRDRDKYVKSPAKTFLGSDANIWDKNFIFHLFDKYEEKFKEEGLLDTDDVVISMASSLSTAVWDRKRSQLGFDYVMVDEAHLFNENERRVLPLLTRGESEYPRLVMTFDEAQSIGGSRGLDLDSVGIIGSERKNLHSIYRCSPDIFALARDLVERSPLAFTEFLTDKNVSRMVDKELARCRRPTVVYTPDLASAAAKVATKLKAEGFWRVAVIIFDRQAYDPVLLLMRALSNEVFEIEQRGEKLGAVPKPGLYIMSPEACGGLEFDAAVLVGVDEGCVPPLRDDVVSPEAYQSVLEEAFMEVYTAVTRAKFTTVFICDENRKLSPVLEPARRSNLIVES